MFTRASLRYLYGGQELEKTSKKQSRFVNFVKKTNPLSERNFFDNHSINWQTLEKSGGWHLWLGQATQYDSDRLLFQIFRDCPSTGHEQPDCDKLSKEHLCKMDEVITDNLWEKASMNLTMHTVFITSQSAHITHKLMGKLNELYKQLRGFWNNSIHFWLCCYGATPLNATIKKPSTANDGQSA